MKTDIRSNASFLSTCNLFENAGIVSGSATKSLRIVTGLTQHHDAITGTEKQHVVDDYNQRLKKAEISCLDEIETKKKNEKVTLVNSLSFDRKSEQYNVVVPGFGWVVVDKNTPKDQKIMNTKIDENTNVQEFILHNSEIGATFEINSTTSKITITDLVSNTEKFSFEHSWKYFLADPGCDYPCIDSGNGTGLAQPSGAYVMRPLDNIEYTSANIDVSKTENSVEISQDYINFRWRLFKDHVLLEYKISELPVFHGNFTGREVFSRFRILSENYDSWFTDTNSMGFIERSREITRPMDPIASRYFPITSSSYLKNTKNSKNFIIHSNRAAGVISQNPGELDFMLHRRTLKDDWKGLNQSRR